jgi:hypothetical protein
VVRLMERKQSQIKETKRNKAKAKPLERTRKDSTEVEESEFKLPNNIVESVRRLEEEERRTKTMENNEAMKDMGREMSRALAEGIAAALGQQNDTIRQSLESNQRNAEDTRDAFRSLVNDQGRNHREDMEALATQFQRLQTSQAAAQELTRTQFTQKLPNYDGMTLAFDDWQDKVQACIICNRWTEARQLMTAMPASLSGAAKRAFDAIPDQEKNDIERMFKAMRMQLDPQSEQKNKEMFMEAVRNNHESVTTFINRSKMYIRRSGEDPNGSFAREMMKFKVLNTLPLTDRKILKATLDKEATLEELVAKADEMLISQAAIIGAVSMGETQDKQKEKEEKNQDTNHTVDRQPIRETRPEYNGQTPRRHDPTCWKCEQPGHIRRNCPLEIADRYMEEIRNARGRGGPRGQQEPRRMLPNFGPPPGPPLPQRGPLPQRERKPTQGPTNQDPLN